MHTTAIVCTSLDGPDGLQEQTISITPPPANHVRIRVLACALNFMDTLVTRGRYQYRPDLPFSPSGEVCGIVEETGPGCTRLTVGQRVMGYIGWGGARAQLTAPEDRLVVVPDGISDEAAAGLSITYGTALHGLSDRAQIREGETVAVLGASGGAGLAGVEIAKASGARVIAVASSEAKLRVCQEHGADELVLADAKILRDELKKHTGGVGVDCVYDCVGGALAEPAVRACAWRGRFLVVGFASGDIPKLPLNLLLLKGCSAVGVFWGRFVDEDTARYRGNMEQLLAWTASGRLKPRVEDVRSLSDAADALRDIAARRAVGKIILKP
ncbi:MAG: NADPH:quinone oxidoreductase family protein [Pseudomonadota bacterium]